VRALVPSDAVWCALVPSDAVWCALVQVILKWLLRPTAGIGDSMMM